MCVVCVNECVICVFVLICACYVCVNVYVVCVCVNVCVCLNVFMVCVCVLIYVWYMCVNDCVICVFVLIFACYVCVKCVWCVLMYGMYVYFNVWYMYVPVCMTQSTCGGHRTTLRSWLSFHLVETGSLLFLSLCCLFHVAGLTASGSFSQQECWNYCLLLSFPQCGLQEWNSGLHSKHLHCPLSHLPFSAIKS